MNNLRSYNNFKTPHLPLEMSKSNSLIKRMASIFTRSFYLFGVVQFSENAAARRKRKYVCSERRLKRLALPGKLRIRISGLSSFTGVQSLNYVGLYHKFNSIPLLQLPEET